MAIAVELQTQTVSSVPMASDSVQHRPSFAVGPPPLPRSSPYRSPSL